MTRNLILFMAMLIGVILAVNSAKRIHSFAQTSQKVQEAEDRLETLRKENETLKNELKYKESAEFSEKEIRDKLGLAKKLRMSSALTSVTWAFLSSSRNSMSCSISLP